MTTPLTRPGDTQGPSPITIQQSPTAGSVSEAFKTIAVPSGTNPVADGPTDTLTLTAGAGITITGDSGADSIAIASTCVRTQGPWVFLADATPTAIL